MQRRTLGRTGVEVSRLCFGTLTVGPLQANLSPKEAARIFAHAISRGIDFFDTAQLYETYKHLNLAMKLARKHDIVIASKTYAHTPKLAEEAVEEARRALNRDYIDIFMLHEQESANTLRGHRGALERLMRYKSDGVIRAVGASMHHVAAVYGAIEFGVDVIHPLMNLDGFGVLDGSRDAMEAAVSAAHGSGIGVFAMKPLGGGNLFRKAEECLGYMLGLDCVDSFAIGMQSIDEVDANIEYINTGKFSPEAKARLAAKTRKLHIESWCEGCAKCVERCNGAALRIRRGVAVCNAKRCVLCGYCAATCGMGAIKVV
jgi:aryl-alcohol dehydrogenase-like predicted oxidoreductase